MQWWGSGTEGGGTGGDEVEGCGDRAGDEGDGAAAMELGDRVVGLRGAVMALGARAVELGAMELRDAVMGLGMMELGDRVMELRVTELGDGAEGLGVMELMMVELKDAGGGAGCEGGPGWSCGAGCEGAQGQE